MDSHCPDHLSDALTLGSDQGGEFFWSSRIELNRVLAELTDQFWMRRGFDELIVQFPDHDVRRSRGCNKSEPRR